MVTSTSTDAQRIADLEAALAEMTAERDGWKRNAKVILEDRILRLEDSIIGLKRHNAELKAALAEAGRGTP
jgi:hypothetical protein